MIKKGIIICFCSLLVSCTKNSNKSTESSVYKNTRIEKLLNNIKYSDSPRLSIKYCKDILEIDPKNGEAYYKLAETYKAMANIVVSTEAEKKYYDSLSIEAFKKANELGYKKEVE